MTSGVLYDSNNIAVGNAVVYYKPWIAGTPAVLVPDATVIFVTTVWEAASWVGMGATDEGFAINVETSATDITIEEQSTPAAQSVESRGITIEAALAESTIENIKIAWNGSTITTAVGPPSKKSLTLTDVVNYWAIAMETRTWQGFARRILIPKATINGSGSTRFRRAADKQMFPIRITSICPPTSILIADLTS